MSAPMVRETLAGTKLQTRRAVKPLGAHHIVRFIGADDKPTGMFGWCVNAGVITDHIACPYGQPGDRLWVREAWAAPHKFDAHRPADIPALTRWHYAATEELGGLRGRPSIHMPRCASRITLKVTGVRVERLQDISEADALAEGIAYSERFNGYCIGMAEHFHSHDPRESYRSLWRAINGAGSWDANPWVWVVEFKKVN